MTRHKTQGLLLSLVLILAAVPAAPAQAATTAQLREIAAQGWHQTYEAYGRTITVDIPIQVPDAEQYPVLSAAYTPQLTTQVVSDWPEATVYQDIDFFRLDSHSPQSRQQAFREYPNDPPSGMDVRPIYLGINQLEMDTAYAYNNPSTVLDGLAIMETVWADNFPDVQIAFTPYAAFATGEMRMYNTITDTFSGDPWHYQGVLMVYMHQVIDGIPVLCPGEQCFAHFDKAPYREGNLVMGGTTILQKMPDDDAMFTVAITQHTFVKTGAVLQALPLCGLEQVIHTYEQLIEAGLLRRVSSLQLGYVAWQAEDGSFTLTPAWVLTGDLYAGPNTPSCAVRANMDPRIPEHGAIVVSALTAELIDPARLDLNSLYP